VTTCYCLRTARKQITTNEFIFAARLFFFTKRRLNSCKSNCKLTRTLRTAVDCPPDIIENNAVNHIHDALLLLIIPHTSGVARGGGHWCLSPTVVVRVNFFKSSRFGEQTLIFGVFSDRYFAILK